MAQLPSVPPSSAAANPPLRPIPGSYGWPVAGAIADRLNYFWFQGPSKFFRNKMEKYKSPVFRTNVPPCFPFFAGVNPKVVMVLDCKSYSHLFDTEIADKKDTLLGDFMPSVGFNGDLRMCAYQDVFEPKHSQIWLLMRVEERRVEHILDFSYVSAPQRLILPDYSCRQMYVGGLEQQLLWFRSTEYSPAAARMAP